METFIEVIMFTIKYIIVLKKGLFSLILNKIKQNTFLKDSRRKLPPAFFV